MTNLDYWQTIVGPVTPEEFLRTYGTADPELGLERFLEDRGHFCGVVNQGTWVNTFVATEQYQLLTIRIYLQSYLEETREDWQPALEAQPPKVVRRYRPVYDLPVPDKNAASVEEASELEPVADNEVHIETTDSAAPDGSNQDDGTPSSNDPSELVDAVEPSVELADQEATPQVVADEVSAGDPAPEASESNHTPDAANGDEIT